jgi:hypothetical protein
MKTLSTFILALALVFSGQIQAQSKLKKLLWMGSGQLVSGFLDGTIESISYHYDNGFKLRFKKVNDQFWDPCKSWTNKYRNGDPKQGEKFMGSTTCFAFTTDAYHMLRTTKRTIDGVSMGYLLNDDVCNKKLRKKQKFKNAAKDFMILTAIRCVGFHLSYSLLFRRQQVN